MYWIFGLTSGTILEVPNDTPVRSPDPSKTLSLCYITSCVLGELLQVHGPNGWETVRVISEPKQAKKTVTLYLDNTATGQDVEEALAALVAHPRILKVVVE